MTRIDTAEPIEDAARQLIRLTDETMNAALRQNYGRVMGNTVEIRALCAHMAGLVERHLRGTCAACGEGSLAKPPSPHGVDNRSHGSPPSSEAGASPGTRRAGEASGGGEASGDNKELAR